MNSSIAETNGTFPLKPDDKPQQVVLNTDISPVTAAVAIAVALAIACGCLGAAVAAANFLCEHMQAIREIALHLFDQCEINIIYHIYIKKNQYRI